MPFGKKQSHSRFNKNPITGFIESRLVFRREPDGEAIEEERLPKSYVVGMSSLENRISQLNKDIASSKERGRIKRLFGGSGAEEKQALAIAKREACEKEMKALSTPIESKRDFETALKEVGTYDSLLANLRTADLDQYNIRNLVESDISSFFSESLHSKLMTTSARMVTADKALTAAVSPSDNPKIRAEAVEEWKVEEVRLKAELKKLKKEKGDQDDINNIEASLNGKVNWINRRAAQLEAEKRLEEEGKGNEAYLVSEEAKKIDPAYLDLIRRQLKDKKATKTKRHRLTDLLETQSLAALADKLAYEDKLEVNNILLEARAIRQEAIRNYLLAELQKLTVKAGTLKDQKNKAISEDQKKDILRFIKGFGDEHLKDPGLFGRGPEQVKDMLANIEAASIQVDQLTGSVEAIQNRSQVLEELKAGNRRMIEMVRGLDADAMEQVIAKVDQQYETMFEELPAADEKWNKKGGSVIRNNATSALKGLLTSEGLLLERQAELENDDKKPIDDERLFQMKLDMERYQHVFEKFDRKDDAMAAKEVIESLAGLSDANEMMSLLTEKFGDRIKKVSSAEFEEKYRRYTKTGDMVFYQRGNDWGIIINEAILADNSQVDFLRQSLRHELRHLQFEHDPNIRSEYIDKCLSDPNWSRIKERYVELYPEKSPPNLPVDFHGPFHTNDWNDEDVISELYAIEESMLEGKLDPELTDLMKGILPITMYRGMDEDMGLSEATTASEDSEGAAIEEGVGSADTYKFDIKSLGDQINNLRKDSHVGMIPGLSGLLSLMKKYHNETAQANKKFDETDNPFWGAFIKPRIIKVREDLKKIETDLAEVAEKMPNESMNPLRNLWNHTTFNSIDDILQVGIDVKEWLERRHNRKKADHAARIGTALFSNIPFLGDIGTEFQARKEKAESEEVNEWQDRLKTKDAWELLGILKRMTRHIDPNRDQFKAILRILADKGRIDWRNESIWKLLNKLQNKAYLKPDDQILLHNPIILRQKLHMACGEIWDYDEFLTLERTNESSYDSGKEKYMPTLDKIQDQITARLDQLLRKHKNGENVDPQEYEALLEYSVKEGKSYAENIMFHLIMGSALGIITPDRGLALDSKYVNKWPATQWILSKKPPLTRKDYETIATTKFANSYNNGKVESDFMNFYWTEVQNDLAVIQRVRKSVSERDWDHDWGRSIACMGDANTAKRFLSGRSGQQEAKDTGVENAYVGTLQWFEENAKKPSIAGKEGFARQIAWVAMADGIIDHVAYKRGANDIYTRGNASILNAVAREAQVGNHDEWTTRQHRNQIREFMDQFDAPFFAMLRDAKSAADDPKAHGAKIRDYLAAKYPSLAQEVSAVNEIDDIFDKMDAIIQAMVASTEDGKFKRIVASIRTP